MVITDLPSLPEPGHMPFGEHGYTAEQMTAYARAAVAAAVVENQKLRTVLIAAAEEIHAHWAAHCDADGYGPQNLMRRLEEGIPSEYGYTAGAFAQLGDEKRSAVLAEREACASLVETQDTYGDYVGCWFETLAAKIRARTTGGTND